MAYRLLLLLLVVSLQSKAAIVDTLDTYSNKMKKTIKAVVIRPENPTGAAMPVLYLLHGYSDNYAGWISKVKDLGKGADLYGMLIVCPDGGFSSWYWDSPIDPAYQYETYITEELIPFIDKKFKTMADRKGRAITGLSMGGHGALYLAIRHQQLFGAAGSMSGGVDIRPFPLNWDMAKRLGAYAEQPERWEKSTVINQLYLLTPGALALIIDCGTSDFFYGVNEELHRQLLYRNIPHDYISRPGMHEWKYWGNAIWYQLLFFDRYFHPGY
ncbi:MAG TPA: alpha/beta hydrolase family protein [Flavihumibacter sp.]|nr:alpha/beta hydrolase family protein [Flavihumibacter sp.]